MSFLEVVAVVSSAAGIWLMTRRSLTAWPVTLLACFLYAAVFREARLYSDMLLQAVYAAFCVYGWWHWLQGVREQGSVRVEAFPWQGWLYGIAAGALGSILLGFAMARYTNAALPHIDASLTDRRRRRICRRLCLQKPLRHRWTLCVFRFPRRTRTAILETGNREKRLRT